MERHREFVTGMHREAQRLAFAYYLRKGRVPAKIGEILFATESTGAFDEYCKFNPDQPRVPAGSPDGGQWTDAGGGARNLLRQGEYPKSKIRSVADAETVERENAGKYLGGSAQCAALTHALSPELPSTRFWQRGEWVYGNGKVPVGTPIATFNFYGEPDTNGYGPANARAGKRGYSHTGIYVGQSKDGLIILHQYQGSGGPKVMSIPWESWGKYGQEGGKRYYTIDY